MISEPRAGFGKRRYILSVPAVLFMISVILCVPFSSVSVGGDETAPTDRESLVHASSALRDKWGIEIVSLRLTAEGHILDLRYRVLDPVKAFPVLDSKVKPILIHEESGRDLSVYTAPRIGGLRQKTKRPEAGRVYFILFSNPGMLLKEGSNVTFQLDDVKIPHIPVGEGKPSGERTSEASSLIGSAGMHREGGDG